MDLWRTGLIGLADPSFHGVHAVDGNTQDLCPGVFDGQSLDLPTFDLDALEPSENPDAVVHVNDVVSGGELGQALQGGGSPEATTSSQATRSAEDLMVREHPEWQKLRAVEKTAASNENLELLAVDASSRTKESAETASVGTPMRD